MLNHFGKRPGAQTPQTTADKFATTELVAFERFCRDNEQWAEMKKCYADAAIVNVSWFQGSASKFIEASSSHQVAPAHHKIHNTLVWLNGSRAIALMTVTIQIPAEIKGVSLNLLSDSQLLYRMEKINGTWLIEQFDCIYVEDSLVPEFPNNRLDIPADAFDGFRKSYACISYNAQFAKMEVNEELPGTDRPDLVNQLYQNADSWLDASSD